MQKIELLLGSCLLPFILCIHIVKAQDYYVDIPLIEDTYVEEGFPTTSPWNNRNLYVGYDTWYGKKRTRMLIKPDLTKLTSQEVVSKDIRSAYLMLTAYESEALNIPVTVSMSRAKSNWSMSTVTWNTYPGGNGAIQDTTNTVLKQGTHSFSVRNSIQHLLNTGINNAGITITFTNETLPALIFWATGCELAPTLPRCTQQQEQPYIRVVYTENELPSVCGIAKPLPNLITNASDIVFRAMPSSDTEGDPITYEARVCTTATCETIAWVGAVSATQDTTIPIPNQGTYILQCSANDHHQERHWGSPVQVTIDTTPPPKPVIIPEPAFTASLDNAVAFIIDDHELLEYRILSSERESFTAYNTYSEWAKTSPIHILHTKEKKYYYKLQSRDQAGNISEWSNSTATTIDTTIPTFSYVKVSTSLISHRKMLDYWVDGAAYIQAGVSDIAVTDITMTVSNRQKKIVYTETKKDSSYLWTHWPEKTTYEDGVYFVQFSATDGANHTIISDTFAIILDKTPPPPAQIVGINNKIAYNRLPRTVTTNCLDSLSSKVYLGNEKIHSGTPKTTFSISPPDGNRTLRVSCSDAAGNTSETSISFGIDTKPPAPPSITLTYNEQNLQLVGSVYCRESGVIQYFTRGIFHSNVPCESGKYATAVLATSPSLPELFSIQARASDSVGNVSDLASKSLFVDKPKENQPILEKISCIAIYNMSLSSFSGFQCTWPTQFLLGYLKTIVSNKTQYSSSFLVRALKETEVLLTIKRCKPRTFFDVRTWFGCFEEIISTQNIQGNTIPIFASTFGVENLSANTVHVLHSTVNVLSLKQKFYTHIAFEFDGMYISHGKTSGAIEKQFSLTYPKGQSAAYFSWIFSGPRAVSQWHGYTAYQFPHKGIDFSVKNDVLLVPANGQVVSARYDKTNECNAGGNYVAIKHENGLYTYYFHLASLTSPTGIKINPGLYVKTGTQLATTGNSGMFNCQPLGYHVHFEVRTSQSPKDHQNPVPYFNIDWNTIKTSQSDIYPARLVGDNPHPKF